MAFNVDQPAYKRLRLIHAERRRPIVFWVGAGLSQPAGLPSWLGLRDALLTRAIEIAATLPEPEGSIKEEALDRASIASSLWDSFQILKNEMGRTEFREEIREILGVYAQSEIPDIYREIWSLPGVRGMLTLNLDEFARISHNRVRIFEDAAAFVGKNSADYAHILGAGRSFIANLHGVVDAQSSWVFTRDEISALVSNRAYKDFIGFIFSQMTVVFCGISAEDSAAGGFLEGLTRSGLDLGSHFWITDRSDPATYSWASDAGVGVIRYLPITHANTVSDHTTPLKELFSDLRTYISTDSASSPILPNVPTIGFLPPVHELLAGDVDKMRTLLSGYAKNLLEKAGESPRNSDYEDFLREYAPCIHQAWWLTTNKPYNYFYNNEIEAQISSSPFSTVWRLRSKNGDTFALKVLRLENLINGPEIDSFRRGTQSLSYLTNAAVPGTPKLISAFEIPTSLIMEFVEGDSLQEIVEMRTFNFWEDGICIMESVCNHLRYGHNLPQSVLHRDVRPSNIMVPYFYWQPELDESSPKKHDVKLLNYDMSWHANAKGQTISGNIEESGYYAPEYVEKGDRAGRTTLVDSYGVGMCIYYAFTKLRPPAGGSKSTDWEGLLERGFRNDHRLHWQSAPIRMRRLVKRATAPVAADRPMIDQIGAELSLIRRAVNGQKTDLPADFWAEELLSHSEQADYVIDESGVVFSREPRIGRKIIIEGNIKDQKITVSFINQAVDSTNRSKIDKIWSEKLNKSREILRSSGWTISDNTRYTSMELILKAECRVSDLQDNFQKLLDGLKRGLIQIRID